MPLISDECKIHLYCLNVNMYFVYPAADYHNGRFKRATFYFQCIITGSWYRNAKAYEVKTSQCVCIGTTDIRKNRYQSIDQIKDWTLWLPLFGRWLKDKANGQTTRISLSRLQLTEKPSTIRETNWLSLLFSINFCKCMLIFWKCSDALF